MGTLQACLSGFRFCICLGWLTGVIFTKSPLRFSEFKSWKNAHAAVAILLTTCTTMLALDFIICNVIGLAHMGTMGGGKLNQVSMKLTQGLAMAYIAEMTVSCLPVLPHMQSQRAIILC